MRILTPILLTLSMGCEADPTGIWLLTLTPEESGLTCTESLVENFTYGYESEDLTGAEWSVEESASYAQELLFIEIVMTGEEQAVLVWGDETWPGSKGPNQWDFGWSETSSSETTSTHIAGYTFSSATTDSSDDGLSLILDGTGATGQLVSTTTSQIYWEESDLWSENLASEIGQTGSIPSSSYLVELVPGSEGETAVSNLNSSADCDADPCRIQLDSTCTQTWNFTAILTETALQHPHDGGTNP